MNQWLPIISTGLNLGLLIVGFKLIRAISQLEFKVELMWTIFERRFGAIRLNGDEEKRVS